MPILCLFDLASSHSRLPASAARVSIEYGARVQYASDGPWSEKYPFQLPFRSARSSENAAVRYEEIVDVPFLPGETRKVVRIDTPPLVGKRLFLQSASVTTNLPEGQSVSLGIGYQLHLNADDQAMIGLYAQGTTAQVQVTRDSSLGSGHVVVIIDGDYENAPKVLAP